MNHRTPLIVDIKRGATEDGPGIRTTVFFKGCPLSCVWCQNPEAIDSREEIGFYANKCIGCGACAHACPNEAIALEENHRIVRAECLRCGACADACPARALRRIGRVYEIPALVDIILRDRFFYEASGGGVTLSGGEPTRWPVYAGALLRALKEKGIHTALQTGGHFDYEPVATAMLPWLDLVLFDLKIMDPSEHARYTGRGNERILDNFLRLLEHGVGILPRTPLIPGHTDSAENLSRIAGFLAEHHVDGHRLLPYNPLGQSKRESLGTTRQDDRLGSPVR